MAGPYYYDPENGSEANDGLSVDTPRQLIPGQTGAIAVSAGTAGNPTVINIKNGTTTSLRIVPTGNYFTYRGYGLASNVLWLTLPSPFDVTQTVRFRAVRESGVHEGMWNLANTDYAGAILSFGARTNIVVEDCRVSGTISTGIIALGSSGSMGSYIEIRRCEIPQAIAQGIGGYSSSVTIEQSRFANIGDDAIALSGNATNSYRAGTDIIRDVELYEPGCDVNSAIGDGLELGSTGGQWAGTLVVQGLYMYKTTAVKQAIALNSNGGNATIERFHFDCPNDTGHTQFLISNHSGNLTIRNGYLRNGVAENPVFRLGVGAGTVVTTSTSRIAISNIIVEAGVLDSFFTWASTITPGSTVDGAVVIENCTMIGENTSGLSIAAAISGHPSTTVTLGGTASLIAKNNLIMVSGAPPAIVVPAGKGGDPLYAVQNNAFLDTATFVIVGTSYASVTAFQAAHDKATGNLSGAQASMLLTGVRPGDGSPLIAAGIHAGYGVDATRTQRWNPPTIGAYEYVRARPSRL